MESTEKEKQRTLRRFARWINQTKYINRIYIFCFAGAVISPIAWFSFFYLAAIYIRRNPLVKNLLLVPFFIIIAETFVQACLIYANVKMSSLSGGQTSNVGFVYLGTIIVFLLITAITAKIHLGMIKRMLSNLNNHLNNGALITPKFGIIGLIKSKLTGAVSGITTKVKKDFE